jgi:hypothetical protein
MSTRARRIALPVVLIVGTMVLLIGVARLTQGPRGPDSSSYATAPRGAGAYAELLARAGHPVRRIRGSLSQTTISAASTVIVLDPRGVLASEVGALRRFLQRGGRVLAGASPPGAWLRELVGAQAPTWEQGGPTRPGVLARAPETAGVQTIFTDGAGRWTEARGALSLVGDDSGALALIRPVGRGRLVLLADVSPLQNRLLAGADNAAFALALIPSGTVAFAEGVHGYGRVSGLAAIPGRWRLLLAGLLAATLVLVLSRARRLGPPQDGARPMAPPRGEYVDALAAALKRTRMPDEASASVATAARVCLGQRARLGPGASPEAWRSAAGQAGLADDEITALLGRAASDEDVLARGRALAKLSGKSA